ncbi:MAG: DUF5665 domain-containing protein [Candidatus Saccharibacteria bacterium]|nr:DUF5665 domain-containing protein [Candidatus Saccharibacteria bacterium]
MSKSVKKLERSERSEREARIDLLDDLFFDLYRNPLRIYKINFIRGIFFGLGTFLGGTVLITFTVIILSWLVTLFPPLSQFFNWIIETLSR